VLHLLNKGAPGCALTAVFCVQFRVFEDMSSGLRADVAMIETGGDFAVIMLFSLSLTPATM